MPVVTTYQDIFEMGYAKSTKNQPDEIATEATELLGLVHRALSGLYSVAARFAPSYFGVISSPVSHVAPGWARPGDAENVFRVKMTDGTTVEVLSLEDLDETLVDPAVYELGGVYRLHDANTVLTTGDALVFWYAKNPSTPTAASDTLDALWKESYNELLAHELALFLAHKDGREEEFASATAERNRWARLFVSHLQHHTSAKKSRFAQSRRITSEMLQALDSVLTPGSEAMV